MSSPRLELRLPGGLSPRTRVGALAESGEEIALLASPGSASLIFDAAGGRFRLSARVSRESGLRLAFQPAEGDEVLAVFTAALDLSARVRSPPRRKKGLGPAFAASAEGAAALRLGLALPARSTLAGALRRVSRWALPRAWAGAGRLPRGEGWQFEARRAVELGGELRLGRVLALAPGAVLPSPARVSGDLRLGAETSWILRSRLRLYRDGEGLLALEAVRDLGGERELLWRLSAAARPLAGAEELAGALLDALPAEISGFVDRAREALAALDELQRRLDALPGEVRKAGRLLAGPGSRLQELIDRLRRAEQQIGALADGSLPRRWRARLRDLREAAEKVRDGLLAEADGWALRLGTRVEQLTLGGLRGRLARWLARVDGLAGVLAVRAAETLAEGFAAEFESLRRGRRRTERLIDARVRPSSAAATALTERLLGGDWRAAELAGGERGLVALRGSWIREQQRLRRRGLRLRLFGAEAFASREWLSQARIHLSLDGALEIGRRERLVRTRTSLLGGDLARLVIELGITRERDRSSTDLSLSWERGWRGPRSSRRALRELRELLALFGGPGEGSGDGAAGRGAESGARRIRIASGSGAGSEAGRETGAGTAPPGAEGTEPGLIARLATGAAALPSKGAVRVTLRLDRRAVRSLLAREESPGRWERRRFWPAWNLARGLTAPKDEAARLGDGRVATASDAVRRALARAPEGRTLEPFLPRASAARREILAAEYRTARALLRALLAVRRLGDDAGDAERARAARRVLAAFGHLNRVDRTPLLVIALLVAPRDRRLELRLLSG